MGRTAVLVLLLAIGLQLAECARNRTSGGRKGGGGKKQQRADIQAIKQQVAQIGPLTQQVAQILKILAKDDCDPNPCGANETCVSRVKNYYCQAEECETEGEPGGSGGSGGSGSGVQAPEAGTIVHGVCPVRRELGEKRTNCHDVETNGISGVYTVNIAGHAKRVYCDMSTAGGGWIVFQRRMDGSVNFARNWNNYAEGFGHPNAEFWMGNTWLHMLTSNGSYQLRVDLADKADNCGYAYYSNFRIADEDDNFRLETVGTYSGDAGDALTYHKGRMFSTVDQDHDSYPTSCSVGWGGSGGWWFGSCLFANLNGKYAVDSKLGDVWQQFKGRYYALPFTEMKIRPN